MTGSAITGTPLGSDAPCVVVLHEVWGLDSHIADVCKRLRKLGFATAVPDLYRVKVDLLTRPNIQKAMEAVWDLSLEERRDKEKVAAEPARRGADGTIEVLAVLYDQRFRRKILEITLEAVGEARAKHRRVATLGFSLGGGLSLAAVAAGAPLDAAVAYCAEPPKSGLGGRSVPVLAIYASQDELMNPRVPAFIDAALKQEDNLTIRVLPNTRHDFFNRTKEDFNRAAADEAWKLTEWFLAGKLRRRRSSKK